VKSKVINEGPERVYAVIFDKGEEVVSGLKSFAEEHHLSGSHFTAIGAFHDVTLGYFMREKKSYKKIPLREQVEVLVLYGDVAKKQDGGTQIHAHVVVGRSDGTTRGGHLLEAHVWPTLEVIVEESPGELKRKSDPETGLTLIDVED
jgi:predicted DNA-binding protein with PD1-like motif